MGWTNANIAKINVKDANSPGDSFTFDGMAAIATTEAPDSTNPNIAFSAIQAILDIGGLSATRTGITRTIKQGDDVQ